MTTPTEAREMAERLRAMQLSTATDAADMLVSMADDVERLNAEAETYKQYAGSEIFMSDFQTAGQMRRALEAAICNRNSKPPIDDAIQPR